MFCTGGSAWPVSADRYVVAVNGTVVLVTTWGALLAGLSLPIGGVVYPSVTLQIGDPVP